MTKGKLIDGRALADDIKEDLAREVETLRSVHNTIPTLAAILVGNDEPSKIYIRMKEKAANSIGMRLQRHEFESSNTEEIVNLIHELNTDRQIHGILVQLPLPEGIDSDTVLSAISPEKDVDGFTPYNFGSLVSNRAKLEPCTPLGIMKMLDSEQVPLEGKNVVIINHSIILGKPLAMMLLKRDATVTVCHAKTRELAEHTKNADVLITAAGVPGLVTEDMVKEGIVVIDAGIKKEGKNVVGDVDFEEVRKKASMITPVPGGVGPMTVAMVLYNTVEAAKNQIGNKNL